MSQVGRYTIDRLLARGGMAEVFVARAEGPAGFTKNVVIKRILPELAEEPTFVEMFLNEARVSAQLSHPNIVQVFDFGAHEGQYYIAMEYIEGETLRTLMRAHEATKSLVNPSLAVKLIAGVCEGLHYAHNLCDEEGKSFQIIHRDVSPDNILVANSGVPKVLDFGIAKAASKLSPSTSAGTVKGKYAYMCAEQIRGEVLDRRVDVYALGITLYEVLSGQRPYKGDNELALLQQIMAGQPASLRALNPEVPEDLEIIVATAMNPDRTRRYDDCRMLQLELEDYLSRHRSRPSWVDLGALVDQAAKLRKAREGKVDSSGARRLPGRTFSQPELPTQQIATPVSFVGQHDSEVRKLITRRSPAWWAAGGLAAAALAVVAGFWVGNSGEAPALPAATSKVASTDSPPKVPLLEPLPPPPLAEAPADAAVALTEPTPEVAPVGPPIPRTREPAPVRTGEGFLTVRSEPWCEVYVDGEKVGTTPLIKSAVPAGRHALLLRNDQVGARRSLSITVAPDKESTERVVFGQGRLFVEAPSGTQVFANGRLLGTTPLDPPSLVEGAWEVKLINKGKGREETRAVRVKPDGRHLVQVDWGL